MIIMGLLYFFAAPKEANHHFGYRCYFGMGSELAWRFTQRLSGIVLGVLGVLTHFDLLGGVEIPILQLGLPAALSIYFDLFSGFVQAFVFSLLSMVYIAGACPPPEEAE